jgi:UDP-glucose 4-epimerase
MMGSNILITGAAGFIGRHVASEFAKNGWHVTGIGHGDHFDFHSYGISEWHQCDITLESLIDFSGKPDVIVHCAGSSSVGFSFTQPAVDFDLTVRITSNVLEFIRIHSPASKLVFLSSAAVYGQVEILPIFEGDQLNPLSPYGVDKLMAESLCQLYARQYALSLAIVRPFSIYGDGLKKQLLWDACQKLSQGNLDFFGSGEEIRDWLHVRDLAELLFHVAIHKSSACSVVNAGRGIGVPVKDILGQLISSFGIKLKPNFSLKSKVGDPYAYVADISNALTLGWVPKIEWQEGVANYVAWYKECH